MGSYIECEKFHKFGIQIFGDKELPCEICLERKEEYEEYRADLRRKYGDD